MNQPLIALLIMSTASTIVNIDFIQLNGAVFTLSRRSSTSESIRIH
ncbi:hypothetical protein X975_02609, partial [Stegodyphus mimosarum]